MSNLLIYSLLNGLGLILDVFGMVLIFVFGLSPLLTKKGDETLYVGGGEEMLPPEERQKIRRYRRLSILGFVLSILGFILQFSSTVFNYKTH